MKKKKQEREMENFLEVLIRNYKTVPGIKIILKLGFYFIFILIFIIVINMSNNKIDTNDTTTTTTEVISKVYRDMISDINNVKKIKVIFNEYTLNLDVNDTINGYLETNEDIKKVIIKDNKLYEINNNMEIENNIFNNVNYIIPNEIIKYLFNNKSIKIDENEYSIYKYDDLNVYIKDEKIEKIAINDSYEIYYN